jgi:hypothetical protein
MAETTPKKQRGRPFEKGRSGNPEGRPAGTLNKATRAAQALLDGEAEALTRKAVEMALAGNPVALRLCLERLVPPRKERPVDVNLPAVGSVADLAQVTAALIDAAARGELTPGEAQALGGLVEAHRKAMETVELERRICALEAKENKR